MQPISEMGQVVAVRQVSSGTWEMNVRAPRISAESKAGQFVHVRSNPGFQPFLRRPLSVGPCSGDCLRLIFTVRGEGTRLLSVKQPGEAVDMIGPLGQPFGMPDPDVLPILVGGGIGVVPLLMLNSQLEESVKRHFLLGVRSRELLPVTTGEIERSNIEVSSDDGSIGFKGFVTQLLEKIIQENSESRIQVYGCGPEPMAVGLKNVCKKYKVPAKVSLEVPMGCGVGACQSCAVPRSDGKGYLLVCKDGPVFDIDQVDLEPGRKS